MRAEKRDRRIRRAELDAGSPLEALAAELASTAPIAVCEAMLPRENWKRFVEGEGIPPRATPPGYLAP